MAKVTRKSTQGRKNTNSKGINIPPKFQHLLAIFLVYLCLAVFFSALVFEGKTYQSSDSITFHSWETFIKDSQSENYIPLWNPYIFCGMPGFASLTYGISRSYDLIYTCWGYTQTAIDFLFLSHRYNGGFLVFYFVYGVGFYLFAFHKFKNKPIALLISLMATYATYVTLLIMMGHITKLAVLAWFPFVFLFVDKLREKFNFLLAIFLTISVHLMISPMHAQYIFYIYLALGLYFVFLLIRSIIKKEPWKGIIISGLTLIFATIFALLMGADRHLSTLEYNPYSTRGANPIQSTSTSVQSKTIEGGLDYDYATSYSFSPGELMTFFIPSWYGFGPLTYQGPLTQNQPMRLYFYLGEQPIVDGPQFMGIVVVLLAIIGFYRSRKESFVQYLGFMIIFALLVSFGKDFPLIYDLMYRYVPMFNKFRAPVLILMLVQFCTPILAGYGITSFIPLTKNGMEPLQKKRWKYILGGLSICLAIALVGEGIIRNIHSSFFSINEVGKQLAHSYGQLNPTVLGMIYDFIFSCVLTDLRIGFVLLILVFGAFYLYQKGTMKASVLYGVLIVIVVFDLWRVGFKTSDPKDRQEATQIFETPNYIKALQQDTTQYRVLKLNNGQPTYDNTLAYWRIQNAYGYHGAKMRSYQDMVDVASIGNPLVWQLMNIKYLISNRTESSEGLVNVYDGQDMKVYAFRAWAPRVFFVNRYEVCEGKATLDKIASMSFNPREVAYLPEDIKQQIDPPLSGTEVKIVKYGTQDLEINASATGNNLLYISEAYYPKGWKAFIDGKETNILRVNYLFRGVIVPKGTHMVTMKFESSSFAIGRILSLTTNLFLCACVLFFMLRKFFLKRRSVKTAPTQ